MPVVDSGESATGRGLDAANKTGLSSDNCDEGKQDSRRPRQPGKLPGLARRKSA